MITLSVISHSFVPQMPPLTNIEEEIRRFLKQNFPLGENPDTLATDASLLDAGVIDSTGVLELVEYVEERFEVQIPDADLLPENFDSVENIVRYLTHRISSGKGRPS